MKKIILILLILFYSVCFGAEYKYIAQSRGKLIVSEKSYLGDVILIDHSSYYGSAYLFYCGVDNQNDIHLKKICTYENPPYKATIPALLSSDIILKKDMINFNIKMLTEVFKLEIIEVNSDYIKIKLIPKINEYIKEIKRVDKPENQPNQNSPQ